jgi:hypothetical protein
MQTAETTIRYGIVRVGGKSDVAQYDVVRHTPGEVDEFLARAMDFRIAAALVKLLNAELGA